MTLTQQLTDDMKNAMRARDSVRLGVIRFLLAGIKNVEIDNGEQDDAGVLKIIQKQVKQAEESIAEYQKAGRTETVSEEQAKLDILKEYLPAQMSDEDLKKIVEQVMAEASEKTMKVVMPLALQKVGDQAESRRVSAMVQSLL